MALANITPAQAATELLRRQRARRSLVDFSQAIEIPGAPVSDDPDEWLFKPIETVVAAHHRLIMETVQATMEQDYGAAMILAPPGSAKSTYASVLSPAWFLGGDGGRRAILASYATGIARKQGRRMRQLCRSPLYSSIFGTTVSRESSAADEWALENGAEFKAAGVMAGITGNRGDLGVIDDPVAGREEADSETIRNKTWEAYTDDFLTRLKPRASQVMILTRWNEDDLAGRILPEGWKGESGLLDCRDGRKWRVVCLPMVAERADDPLGRKQGELLWPEWFSEAHIATARLIPRTWSSLYQQRPAPAEGIVMKRAWFREYDIAPANLTIYMASDFATTADGGDWTVHITFGVSATGDIYVLDLWRKQASTGIGIDAALRMAEKWNPIAWYGEKGVIERAIEPAITDRMRSRSKFVHRELLPTVGNKEDRVAGFAARAEYGTVYVRSGAEWAKVLLDELCSFPAGANDDQVDACGIFGRALDKLILPRLRKEAESRGVQPFTWAWLTANDKPKGNGRRID